MHKTKYIIFFLLTALYLLPVSLCAQIVVSDTSGCAPAKINFSYAIGGLTNIYWNFDDEGTSSGKTDPEHTFINAGTYQVRLTASVGGNPIDETITIRVLAGFEQVGFKAISDVTGCVPLLAAFSDTSVGSGGSSIVKRTWDFDDGVILTTNEASPSHSFKFQGVYDVRLTVTDANGCIEVMEVKDYVKVSEIPVVSLVSVPTPASSCTYPASFSFNGTASKSQISAPDNALIYQWVFDGTDTTKGVSTVLKTYDTIGDYSVRLTVADAYQCSASTVLAVKIGKPKAVFQVSDTICDTATFINKTVAPYINYWTFGDGTSATTVASAKVFHKYAVKGKPYNVTLRVRDRNNCEDDTTMTVYVENVKAGFISDPHYSCSVPYQVQFTDTSVNAARWLWHIGYEGCANNTFVYPPNHPSHNDTTLAVQNPLVTFTMYDTLEYSINRETHFGVCLTVISERGCSDSINVPYNDTIYVPNARFMPDVADGCAPLVVHFSDSSTSREPIAEWYWDFGDGQSVSGTDSMPVHTYTAAGEYDVVLVITNAMGCKDTSYAVKIRVGEELDPLMTLSEVSVCPYDSVSFTDLTLLTDSIDGWHFESNARLLSGCHNDPDQKWVFSDTTGGQDVIYEVKFNGCYSAKTFPGVIQVEGPLARLSHRHDCDTPMLYKFPVTLMEVTEAYLDYGDGHVDTLPYGATSTDTLTFIHLYDSAGDYNVKLTVINENGSCQPFADSITIFVRNLIGNINVPDTLACIGDSINLSADASQHVHPTCFQGYEWHWGDGSQPIRTSETSYLHPYQTTGKVTTRLVVRDINGCMDTAEQVMWVYQVNADFEVDKTYGCLPFAVSFTDSSTADTTIDAWSWSFGDGSTSGMRHPSHTYTQYNTNPFTKKVEPYLAMLTVTDVLGCTGGQSVIIWPSVPDSSFRAVTDTTICVGQKVSFMPNSKQTPMFFSWTFDDVDTLYTDSINNIVTHTFKYPGEYDIQLIVTDSIGCSYARTRKRGVLVQDLPRAGFRSSVDDLQSKCHPLDVIFTDTSVVAAFNKRKWNLGDGGPVNDTAVVGRTYQDRGEYDISLMVESTYGCRDTAYGTLVVVGPVGGFTMDRSTICRGQVVTFALTSDTLDVGTYIWDFGDGLDSLQMAPVKHQYDFVPPSGKTKASLTIWSPDSSCSITYEKTININHVRADFVINDGQDTTVCVHETFALTDSSSNANSWLWDLGDGTGGSSQNLGHSYADSGLYIVTQMATNTLTTCADTISKQVLVHALPEVVATGGDTCKGSPVQIRASGGEAYTWTPSMDLDNPNDSTPFATPEFDTQYTVAVTDSNGCLNTATTMVYIIQPPEPAEMTETIVIGETIQLEEEQGDMYTYRWFPVEGLSCSTCYNPVAQPLEDRTYYVEYKDTVGCFVDTSVYIIIVLPLTTIDVPDVFTPNSDGLNDIVYAKGHGVKQLLYFRIYNRWGQVVFETTDLGQGWDGRFNGKEQPSDTYVWLVEVMTYLSEEPLTGKGYLHLIR